MMASRGKPIRRMDERITLRQRDKIPYGTAVAKQLLPSLFPQANFPFDSRFPGSWDSIETYHSNQAVILIANYFDAEEEELDRLSNFVNKGNTVFIIARSFSHAASRYFHFTFNNYFDFENVDEEDSLQLKLIKPLFTTD